MITPSQRLEYLINVYFGNTDDDYISSAVNRAYLDFSRTQRGFGSNTEKKQIHEKRVSWLNTEIASLLNRRCANQIQFDKVHKKIMKGLIARSQFGFSYGQAQKWVNMSLKYCLVIRPEASSLNEKYFHVPIDNLLTDILSAEGYKKFPNIGTWSKMTDYRKYSTFQKWFRHTFDGEYPIRAELRLWKRV